MKIKRDAFARACAKFVGMVIRDTTARGVFYLLYLSGPAGSSGSSAFFPLSACCLRTGGLQVQSTATAYSLPSLMILSVNSFFSDFALSKALLSPLMSLTAVPSNSVMMS